MTKSKQNQKQHKTKKVGSQKQGKTPGDRESNLTLPAEPMDLDLMAEFMGDDPEELTELWQLGVYNPLEEAVPTHYPKKEEQFWTFCAHMAGFFTFEHGYGPEVLYWTAPPPDFNPNQADWYVRPDLTHFLDEPAPLKDVVQQYPVAQAQLQTALSDWMDRLGWNEAQLAPIIQEVIGFSIPLEESKSLELAAYIYKMKTQFYGGEP